jgi:IS30 family transposase
VLFADQPSRWLCKETIYQAIYDTAVALTRPVRRRRRRRRLLGLQRRGRLTAMRMIDERPAEVEDRVQAGHWEGDLIMGAGNRSAIGTLVERSTRSSDFCWAINRRPLRPSTYRPTSPGPSRSPWVKR